MTKNRKFIGKSSSSKIYASILTFKKNHVSNFQNLDRSEDVSEVKIEVLGIFQFHVFPKLSTGLLGHCF